MSRRRCALAVAVAFGLIASPWVTGAQAGFVTGSGDDRTAHLSDQANGINVTVYINETLDRRTESAIHFLLEGSAATTLRDYEVALIVSPDDPDLRASWNVTDAGPAGATSVMVTVFVPEGELLYTRDNVPFAVALMDASGAQLDSVEFSMDLLFYAPPPDGGLFQLAAGTVAAWGLVLLYAGYLHRAHQRLRAKADSLERALTSPSKEGEK